MTRETKIKPKADQPHANAYFGTFVFLQSRKSTTNKNTKEPKFSNHTANTNSISTGSLVTYKLQGNNSKSKITAYESSPYTQSLNTIVDLYKL
jgi:hypothetical protein